MNKVAILAHHHVTLFEMSCAIELFALPRPDFDPWYKTDVVNLEGGVIKTTGNLKIEAEQVTDLTKYDTLIIPGWPTWDYTTPKVIEQQVSEFVAAGKRVLSLCSGAFLLGRIGALDGKKATTHWMYENAFIAEFPQAHYQKDMLYVLDGQIGCAAGSASALDLGLSIIRQDFGYDKANQVAKRLVVPSHRSGGQAQFVETPLLKVPSSFSTAIEWAHANLDQRITVDDWSKQANMSRRTFDRKFRSSFNLSPKEWLIQQRIERVKGLLETQSTSIEQLATLAGFENATTLRHHFRRIVGIPPKQYQSQFQL